MDADRGLTTKLQSLLDGGKSYYEAAELLTQDGYTRAQIEDAKITLNSRARSTSAASPDNAQHIAVGDKPELADDLLTATAAMSNAERRSKNPPGYLFYANGIPLFNVKITGNIYLYFLLALVLLVGLFVLVRHIIK